MQQIQILVAKTDTQYETSKKTHFSKSVISPDPDTGSKLTGGLKHLRIYKDINYKYY